MKRVALLLSILSLAAAPAQAQWSTATLSQPRAFLGAATVGNYSLFAGGAVNNTGTQSNRVDIYDSTLGAPSNPAAWSTATLSVNRRYVDATVVGQYALFAGGWVQGGGDSAVVDVFDSQTMTWSTATLSQARKLMGATTVGTKALFAGGAIGFLFGSPIRSDRVDIYDSAVGAPSNPAAWSTATLSLARFYMAATTAGNQAIFAGGTDYATAVYDTVDIYDDSTGAWSTASLSVPRAQLGAASVGTKAYFAGGSDSPSTLSAVVDVYEALTGTWSTGAPLSQPRTELVGASLGNQVLFAGGIGDPLTGAASAVVDLFNTGTGQGHSSFQLSQARFGLDATTAGGRIMFAGGAPGAGSPTASAVIDIYEPLGVSYCAATPNSTGSAATISASGSASLAADNLVLQAVDVPNKPFLFIHSSTQAQIPFGIGFLCVGGAIKRIQPGGAAAGGVAQVTVNLAAAGITVPGVRNFQCWFRDTAAGGSGSSTSDAIAITILP